MANKSNNSETKVKTEQDAVKIEAPKGSGRGASVFVAPASVSGFVGFLREHAIVGLAVGFVLGTQVQSVVKQLISSFIDPLFQLFFSGNKTLSTRTFTLHFGGRHADFGWGALAYALIDFLFVAVTIYIIIKLFNLDKLDKKK